MRSSENYVTSRRNVLKTAGVVGLAATLGLSGTAAARPERKGNNFGTGNGIGAFLNEKAEYKSSPVWAGEIVDVTGQDTVEVVTGAMTSVEIPNAPFSQLPVAFAPTVIRISPGTEVVWTWSSYPEGVPAIPHDVVSLDDGLFDSGLRFPGGTAFPGGPVLPEFSYSFDEPGNYLYYCTPHGAPFEVENFEGETVYNEFGMRGAVLVAGE